MTNYALIVAGGKGVRMGTDIPKQFIPVGGRPILMRTIEAFQQAIPDIQIILVLPENQQAYWQELCRQYHFDVPVLAAQAGETRFHSVKNGLALVSDDGLVGVHDGVRPFVSVDVIRRCYELAAEQKAVVPVVEVVETLRHVEDGCSRTVPRHEYRLVQTPQVFDAALLQEAYNQAYSDSFTDDASVVEATGARISLTQGNRENIKITTPYDLKVAQALLCSI